MAAPASDLDVRVRGIDELSPQLQNLESKVIRFVGFVSASLATIRIGTAPIKAAADFERELANVAKTTNFVGDEMKLLSSEIVKLSRTTNVATVDLVKIAAAAGQMGLGKEGVQQVVAFTDSVQRMASVLDITAEQAGTDVGKIINIFKVPMRDIERVVSAFNETSNNSTATGTELLDVVKRIGDATGALNVQQALGLAASGIDFGVSPEVIGTAFSRIFAQLSSKATEFGKLMNVSATDWIGIVQNNGIDAFRQVLARLRELEPQSQQQTIAKLLGGGRIGALVNKFVQDTGDTLLRQNLASAESGFTNANSALKEQATVLATLKEQFNILKNNIFAIGKEAGDEALAPLTQKVAQLSQALQTPGVQSFARAVGAGLAGLVDLVGRVVSAIASLNVNWENFIKLAGAFLALKVFQAFQALGTRLAVVTFGLQSVANSAKAATTATAGLATATQSLNVSSAAQTGSFLTRILGITQEVAKLKELAAARKIEAEVASKAARDRDRAEANARLASNIIDRQSTRQQNATGAGAAASTAIGSASATAGAASAAYRASLQRAAAAEDAINTRRLASLQQKETQHTANLLALTDSFEARKAAIRATGSTAGLTALKREHAAAVAEETTRHADSIARAERYWARQAQIAQTGAAAVLAANKASLQNANVALDTQVSKKAGSAAEAAAAGAVVAAATRRKEELEAEAKRLDDIAKKASGASGALSKLGAAFTALGVLVAAAGRIIFAAFGWVFLIFTVLDALGLLDKVLAPLAKIGEAMGLITKKTLEQTIANEAAAEAEKEKIRRLEDTASAYEKLKKAQTGSPDEVTGDTFKSIEDSFKGGLKGDRESADQGLAKLGTILAGAQAQIEATSASIDNIRKNTVSAVVSGLAVAEKEVQRLELALQRAIATRVPGSYAITKLRDQLAEAEAAAQKLRTEFDNSGAAIGALVEKGQRAALDLARAQAFATEILTEATIAPLENLVLKLKEAEDKAMEAVRREATALTQAKAAGKGKEEESAKAVAKVSAEVAIAQKNVNDLRAALENLFNSVATGNGPKELKDAFAALRVISQKFTTEQTRGLVAGANAAKEAGKTFTGSLTGGFAARKGTEAFDARDREAQARRLATAKVEAARQDTRNQINEEKARSDILARLQQQSYDRGLIAIQDYYAARLEESKRLSDAEIVAKREELAQIDEELKGATGRNKDPSEAIRLQAARRRVTSEIRVLNAQAETGANDATERLRAAQSELEKSILQETANAITEGFSLTNAEGAINAAFQAYLANYATQIAKFEVEGKKGNAAAQRIADQLRDIGAFKAAKAGIDLLATQVEFAYGRFDIYTRKLEVLQQAGVLTGREAANAIKEQSDTLSVEVQNRITQMEQRIAGFVQAGQTNNPFFEKLIQDLEQAKLKLLELAVTADKTAIAINGNITDAIADGLGKLEPTIQSVRDTLLNTVRSIAQNLQQVIARDFAEQIVKSSGLGGSGGIGGLISRALSRNADQNPANAAGSALAKGLAQRGSSALNPLYVIDVKSILPGGDTANDILEKELGELVNGKQDTGILGQVKQAGTEFLSTVKGGLGDIGEALSGMFKGLTGGGGADGSGIAGFLSSLFSSGGGASFGVMHSGGIAGQAAMRRFVHPSAFAYAMRMHNGGIAGLRPREVPTILEEGEKVMTAAQQRSQGSGGEMAIRNVLVTDPNFVPDALQSKAGERVLFTFIERNKPAIKSLLR